MNIQADLDDNESQNTNLDLDDEVMNAQRQHNFKKPCSPNQSHYSEEDTQKTLSDQRIPTLNDKLFYKNVRDILDDKGADDTMSSFEDGDAPKNNSNMSKYHQNSNQL